jgi:two-component system sensor histidine kinase RegB
MRADVPAGPLAEDVELIIAQSQRCGAILAKLRNLGADGDPFAAVPLPDVLAEVARPHQERGRTVILLPPRADAGPAPVVQRTVGLLYGLGNLIENATQFAATAVTVEADWTAERIAITMTDDGPGFAPELMARLGEPYLTTRARSAQSDAAEAGGLGLGIFIAKTLLERTGARLSFDNVDISGSARVTITWPRKALERAADAPF